MKRTLRARSPGVRTSHRIQIRQELGTLTLFVAHPTQTELIKSRDDTMTPEVHDRSAKELHRLAVDTIGEILEEHGLDVVVANSDSTLIAYTACARWPAATVPIGNLADSGQPFGLFVLGRTEDILLKFMLLYERTFPAIARPGGPFCD
jgi:amidase